MRKIDNVFSGRALSLSNFSTEMVETIRQGETVSEAREKAAELARQQSEAAAEQQELRRMPMMGNSTRKNGAPAGVYAPDRATRRAQLRAARRAAQGRWDGGSVPVCCDAKNATESNQPVTFVDPDEASKRTIMEAMSAQLAAAPDTAPVKPKRKRVIKPKVVDDGSDAQSVKPKRRMKKVATDVG
jgi:hypothetical protein